MYGPFTNEELLGKAIRGYRDKLIIATKFGFDIHNGKRIGLNSQPEHIKQVVEESLKRLGIECIDLLYQHRVDPSVPIEEVIGVMKELVSSGKVRYLGLSEAGETTIRRAHAVHPISALQSEYSIWERNLELVIIPLLRKLGIGLVPFAPLGRGFLTGKVKRAEEYPENDYRRTDPRFQGKNFDNNLYVAKIVKDVAKKLNKSPAQIALAWLLHKGNDIVPIPGTKHRIFLEENISAADIHLMDTDIKILDQALPLKGICGLRYNEDSFKFIDR